MTTNFGFQKIKKVQKEAKVQNVFSNVADKYDVMNDIMSFGMHRLWKDAFVNSIDVFSAKNLLDLAGGTGDIGKKFIDKGGAQVVISDLNQDMLNKGKFSIDKKFDQKYLHNIEWVHSNAENLPFKNNSFDYCTISFGLRNVTNIDKVLQEALRVLRPGGKFLCLEFSKVDNNVLSKIYDFYSFQIIPKLGGLVANSEYSYQYLVESIKQFHSPQKLVNIMKDAGFYSARFQKMFFGIVCIHSGYKV
jgi:demethylmenaquinone methyltransferase/2-methoxy-6-polyprenyl-1,4-benzoquinol methylase